MSLKRRSAPAGDVYGPAVSSTHSHKNIRKTPHVSEDYREQASTVFIFDYALQLSKRKSFSFFKNYKFHIRFFNIRFLKEERGELLEVSKKGR